MMFASCGETIEGTFYLSEKAVKYQIDTTITSFTMIDDRGITENFYMDNRNWYATHHYFMEWGVDGNAFGEVFGVAYHSVVNNYFFSFALRADTDHTDMEIEWNQADLLTFDVNNEMLTYGPPAHIEFLDSLVIADTVYRDIIKIDFTGATGEIDQKTPLVTYLSGHTGLIKFERADGIVSKRLR
jgi:hypothetical protein